MSEWREGSWKTAGPWQGIRRFPPVEGPSDEGIDTERKVTHSHLLVAVWSNVLNHKQVSLLLFFHHSPSFSPPFSLRVSEAWETGSKHRSYDSAWPQIKRTGRRRYSLRREEQPQHLVKQIHINIWLLTKFTSCNMQNFDPLLAVSSVAKIALTSDMVCSPADAFLSCSAAKSLMDQHFSVLPPWSCRPGCNCLCGIRWNTNTGQISQYLL